MKVQLRILVACGSRKIRARIREMLRNAAWISTVSEAENPMEALQMIRSMHVDTAILISGSKEEQPTVFEMAHIIRLQEKHIKTIIISENIVRDVAPAVRSSVSALIPLSANKDELITAILSSQNGNIADAGSDTAS